MENISSDANIYRLQVETLFDSIYSLDAAACTGFDRERGNRGWDTRHELLRTVLISLASLIFVRTSTTITMGTSSPSSKEHGLKECMTKLVANEGIASLKADFELVSQSLILQCTITLDISLAIKIDKHTTQILKLVTKLTEFPFLKPEEALIRARR